MMEDTFLKEKVSKHLISYNWDNGIGRIDLTKDIKARDNSPYVSTFVMAHHNTRYRLSTQPSIWNKNFLLHYLNPGLSPWDFETQDPKNDGWDVIGFVHPPVNHNEGVRRFDIHKLNLDGMCQEDINHINSIAPWQTK